MVTKTGTQQRPFLYQAISLVCMDRVLALVCPLQNCSVFTIYTHFVVNPHSEFYSSTKHREELASVQSTYPQSKEPGDKMLGTQLLLCKTEVARGEVKDAIITKQLHQVMRANQGAHLHASSTELVLL